MAQFEATVRLFDIVEPDKAAARRSVEEQLRAAGFHRWQIVSTQLQLAVTPPAVRPRRRPSPTDASYAGGGLLVAAVLAWAMWLLWLLSE